MPTKTATLRGYCYSNVLYALSSGSYSKNENVSIARGWCVITIQIYIFDSFMLLLLETLKEIDKNSCQAFVCGHDGKYWDQYAIYTTN